MDHLFTGSALCAVDRRGRVSLPPFVRDTIDRRADSGIVVIGPHESDPCLSAYDRGHVRIVHADHERRRLAEADPHAHHNRARHIFGGTHELKYGAAAKVTLPPAMRRNAGIEDFALFIGVGGTFEVWSPQAALDSGDPMLRDLAARRIENAFPPAHKE